jgi:hypothetical protein
MPDTAGYDRAMRAGGVAIWYTIAASRSGTPIAGATDLRPTGGTITDTIKPGVAKVLNLEVAADPGLYDLLAPAGTTLTATAHVRMSDRSVVDIPMGVFDVNDQSMAVQDHKITLTAPDKWVRIQRAKFITPQYATPGVSVITQLGALITGALGVSEPVNVGSATSAVMCPMLFEGQRDKVINDIAGWTSQWVRFDRNGTALITWAPSIGPSADWLIDASPSGVLVSLDRQRSRTSSFNVVGVVSSAASGELWAPVYAWDSDSTSPTYAGTDPLNHPELAGPFGVVPYVYDTPLTMTSTDAYATALSILSQTTGLASQVSLSATINPAIDAGDVIDVLAPRERYDIPIAVERHLIETVTHPLVIDASAQQHIEGRSTRTDAFT